MTMNTLIIIMRKQQAVPPPLHPPLPDLGPPSQQVKREQEGQEIQGGFVEGKENEREALLLINMG